MTFPWDDSNLAPPDVADLCRLDYPIKYLSDFGAKANGKDDTLYIRDGIAWAEEHGTSELPTILIADYGETGTYGCCEQDGDKPISGPFFKAIFPIKRGNFILIAERPGVEFKGYFKGMKNPNEPGGWYVTGDGYVKISRFFMFALQSDYRRPPIGPVQFRSLVLDGGCPYDGNFTVGGDVSTGHGWDMGHKAISLNGSGPIAPCLIFNCTTKNFRGEHIYAGGNAAQRINLIGSQCYGSSASIISCSTYFFMHSSTVTQCYNGVENYALTQAQATIIKRSSISTSADSGDSHGHGCAILGVDGSRLEISDSRVFNCNKGILYSEFAHNVTVKNVLFQNCKQSQLPSILGLYPGQPTGFSNFDIDCTADKAGAAFLHQTRIDGLKLKAKVINGSVVLSGKFLQPRADMTVEADIGQGCKDVSGISGYAGVWSSTRADLLSSIGEKIDTYKTGIITLTPHSDWLRLHQTFDTPQLAEFNPYAPLYMEGQSVTILATKPGWVIIPNTVTRFADQVPVDKEMILPSGQKCWTVSFRFKDGLFDLVT